MFHLGREDGGGDTVAPETQWNQQACHVRHAPGPDSQPLGMGSPLSSDP